MDGLARRDGGHRRLRLAGAGLLALAWSVAGATPPAWDVVIGNLAGADARTRTAFTVAALDALIQQHETVLRAARGSAQAERSWVAATRGYVTSLRGLRARASAGAPVRFARDAQGTLRVLVGAGNEAQFMVAAPRPHERGALVRAVIARFCAATGCAKGGPSATRPRPRLAETPSSRHGSASMPARGRAVRLGPGDGLRCPGPAARHARLAARACGPLLAELRALARALRPHADAVDWHALGAPQPDGDAHRVRYDAAGRSVRVSAPTLAAAPEVLDAAAGWMRAVLAGKVADHVLTPPSRLVYQVSVAASGAP